MMEPQKTRRKSMTHFVDFPESTTPVQTFFVEKRSKSSSKKLRKSLLFNVNTSGSMEKPICPILRLFNTSNPNFVNENDQNSNPNCNTNISTAEDVKGVCVKSSMTGFLADENRCKRESISSPVLVASPRNSTNANRMSIDLSIADDMTDMSVIPVVSTLHNISDTYQEMVMKYEIESWRKKLANAEIKAKTNEEACIEAAKKAEMINEELQANHFLREVQQQHVRELEQNISKERLERNEILSNRSRKHKSEIMKLQKEKIEYERRAAAMIQQVNEQMASLQSMAMSRIETLEKELMAERRQHEHLKYELSTTKQLCTCQGSNNSNEAGKRRQSMQDILSRLSKETLRDNEEDDDDDDDDDGNETEEDEDKYL